jgi:tetratricopeptide (TPR) repeat protein
MREAVQLGHARKNLCKKARSIAIQKGNCKDLDSVREDAEKVGYIDPIKKQIENGLRVRKKDLEEKKNRSMGLKFSKVTPPALKELPETHFLNRALTHRKSVGSSAVKAHPNDIRVQPASSEWEILIDETGSEFGESAGMSGTKQGKFVAIAIPKGVELDPLVEGWHAVSCDNAEIDRVMSTILTSSVGVLGIRVADLPSTPGERWMDGVALLVDWLLRWIPISDRSKTKIGVKIENRGVYERGQSWELVSRECLRKLAVPFPGRAKCIELDIQVIGKNDSPCNGYVDAIAFTWALTRDSSKERMIQSGLRHSCLLELTDRSMLHTLDAYAQGVHLPSKSWWEWVSSPSISSEVSSVIGGVLALIGEECKCRPELWQAYLEEVKRQTGSSAVALERLGVAIEWLQNFEPEDSHIPPLLRLIWLTVQIARANHLGETCVIEWQEELATLTGRLMDEAAPLVCHAELNLAVACTNRFEFDEASRLIARWLDCPIAAPGLHRWAQVHSSLGQHEAFRGNFDQAITYFDKAIEHFQRLSDSTVRDREILKTSIYRAIATMDSSSQSPESKRKTMDSVLGDLAEAGKRLACSNEPNDRYEHHLLLRWLVTDGGDNEKTAYMNTRDDWAEGSYHPWPLIELYRALLLKEQGRIEDARDLAMIAASVARSGSQGPTVQLIGACCHRVAESFGAQWDDRAGAIEELTTQLPRAGERISYLASWEDASGSVIQLLERVLPFNFH